MRQRSRKGSVPGRGASPASSSSSPLDARDVIGDASHDMSSAASPGDPRQRMGSEFARARSAASDGDDQKSGVGSESANMSPAVTPQSAPPTPSALAQFSPLSVSTFLPPGALPGILPPALMSQAAFLAQASLTSPSMLGSALPFMTGHPHASFATSALGASSKDVSIYNLPFSYSSFRITLIFLLSRRCPQQTTQHCRR